MLRYLTGQKSRRPASCSSIDRSQPFLQGKFQFQASASDPNCAGGRRKILGTRFFTPVREAPRRNVLPSQLPTDTGGANLSLVCLVIVVLNAGRRAAPKVHGERPSVPVEVLKKPLPDVGREKGRSQEGDGLGTPKSW